MNTPDLAGYHAVHTALRHGAHLLSTWAETLEPTDRRRIKAFRTYWNGYAGEVLAHHTIEDDFFFPALADRVPAVRDQLGRLTEEHNDLDELMAQSTVEIERVAAGVDGGVRAAASVLRELALHMDGHLDFENSDILPLFEQRFTVEEYKTLDDQAMKSLGIGKQAAFTVPFIASAVSDEVRAHLFAGAPMPFRVLYRATRGRHARLAATAFGAVRVPVTAV